MQTKSTTPNSDYAIIIPAYNEEELLPATLTSVQHAMQQTPAWTGHLILVDNDSTDCTAQIAATAGATVVHEPHRQIARARNAGAAATQAPYLIFLDADTQISPQLLTTTLTTLAQGRVAYGGTHVAFPTPSGKASHRAGAIWNTISRTFGWACGAYVYCRHDAFTAVGGFDERYYASEEIQLCKALRRWSKSHGYTGLILDIPIITSDRKMDWFGWKKLVTMCLQFTLNPRSIRSRQACWLWYERPDITAPSTQTANPPDSSAP